MAWDRGFNLLPNFYYYKENKTYRFNLLFLRMPKKIVSTYRKYNANVIFDLFLQEGWKISSVSGSYQLQLQVSQQKINLQVIYCSEKDHWSADDI